MTNRDATTILAIATLAALADGEQDDAERARIAAAAAALGLADADTIVRQAEDGPQTLTAHVAALSSPEARQLAYDTAAAVCHADGWLNPSEGAFLRELSTLLGADPTAIENAVGEINRGTADHAAATQPPPSAMDAHILDQAIITAALELLPDRLANLGILPLQMRLVYRIGQQHGQELDATQVRDLIATLGLGAAAQVLEKVVRRTFGGLAGGLFGGALGGLLGGAASQAAGLASGAAVTFAATYALGHAAERYYAQDRQLSGQDLKALFARFRSDADTIYPRVERRIAERARGGSLSSVLTSIR
ncbi:MAG: DUF533 domain-containing protein [Gemmatimonas sp.]|jgi:tellurite resistance protein/uncharacterized protein (DUF697 family)|uniref:DUF533 domain-containing protein n=1 Tax=Gemmatimonas sp. TaxID=1962908 RepID=UPI00391FA499|nr:DUF533 domain-containing protein [Gemmatimonadota bacterium]